MMADSDKLMVRTELVSPVLGSGSSCLSFSFHTSGENQDQITLSVILRLMKNSYQTLNDTELWSHSGDEGRKWNHVEVPIPPSPKSYRVSSYDPPSLYREADCH